MLVLAPLVTRLHTNSSEKIGPKPLDDIYYRPQTKFGVGNVFTPVCHSVHRGSNQPPPPIGYNGIRSTSGRYASSWNAFLLPPANEVCEGYAFTGVCPQGGHVVAGGMCGCWGACMVARGCAWLWGVRCAWLRGCVVAGGCVAVRGMWLQGGGMCGCGGHVWLQGGKHGCGGVCVVVGGCMVSGGVRGCGGAGVGYDESQ